MDKSDIIWGVGSGLVVAALGHRIAPVISKYYDQRREKTTGDEVAEVCKRSLSFRKPPDIWNDALFFPDKNPELPDSPTERFLSYFRNTKSILQICIYQASNHDVGNIIIEKARQGLIVQVLSDYDTLNEKRRGLNSSVRLFRDMGLQVRVRNSGHLMHNKFAIFDEEAVLTGSLNWTKLGVRENSENVIITTHKPSVKAYVKEFHKLWKRADGDYVPD